MAKNKAKMNKFVTGVATAAMVATAVVPVASAAGFTDLDKVGSAVKVDINKAVDLGFFIDAPKFNPSVHITRGQAALTLARYVAGESSVKAYVESNNLEDDVKLFEDIPLSYKTGATFEQELYYAALVVKNAGAFTQDYLNPAGNVTRSQMAKIVTQTFGLGMKDGFESNLTDVAHLDAETKGFIETIASQDITVVNAFMPAGHVTRSQMASFLVRANDVVVAGEVEEVAPEVEMVTAINNTTVEITYKEDIADVKAHDYKIDGLTVENAVVSQTNDKVVVLTTSAQEGAKKYTITDGKDVVGSFEGVSAVVPTAITTEMASQQGVIGEEVTVSAKVTVPEGDSTNAIPVTFNIQNSDKDNKTIEVEVKTDKDGVATYSYTRYYSGQDNVVAYATKKASVYATSAVYWANAAQLTIADITTETTLVNGSKKVYEINSAQNAGGYVFVAFGENVNVAPDKAVSGAKVEGVTTYILDATGKIDFTTTLENVKVPKVEGKQYPYAYTTGGTAVTAVKLDANGKANLVVTGTNASVTPVVYSKGFVDATKSLIGVDASWSPTVLQAKASTVNFELKHELGLTLNAEGVQNAAIYKDATETGGRDYTVNFTDKDGKNAAPGTKVKIAISNAGVKGNLHVLNSDNNEITKLASSTAATSYYEVSIEKAGSTSFTVSSDGVNDYVSPTAFIDTGVPGLDVNDLQVQGEITYFVAGVTYSAALSAVDSNGKPVTSVHANGSDRAIFEYNLVDQNGKPRSAADSTTVSFEVKAGTGIVFANGEKVEQGGTKTVNAFIPAGETKATVSVFAADPSSVTVSATGSRAGVVLPSTNPASVTVNFSQYGTEAVTGVVTQTNSTLDTLTIGNVVYSYANGKYQFEGSEVSKSAFEGYLTQGVVTISITKDANENMTFNVLSTSGEAAPTLTAKTVEPKVITVGGTPLTLTATELATSNKNLPLSVTAATSSNAAVAATVTNGALVISAVSAGTADVTVNVTDGSLNRSVTVQVTVKEAGADVTLGEFTSAITNNSLGKKVVAFNYSDLPADSKGVSYSIVIAGTTYDFEQNTFDANNYFVAVPETISDADIKAAVLKTVK